MSFSCRNRSNDLVGYDRLSAVRATRNQFERTKMRGSRGLPRMSVTCLSLLTDRVAGDVRAFARL